MHELSIAMSVVEGASQEALKRGSSQVHAVHLRIGALSGVVKDALLFSYGIACEDTPLEGSKLIIEEVPVTVYCPNCNTEKTLNSIQRFCCPSCGTMTPDVITGREIELVAIEISEAVESSQLAEVAI